MRINTGRKQVVTKEEASFTELIDHQEAIILDLENLHYYSLNGTASFLWKQLRTGAARTGEALSAAQAAAFGISAEQAELDVRTYLDELEQYGLISYSPLEAEEPARLAASSTASLPAYEPPQLKLSNSLLHVTLSGSTTITTGSITVGGGV
jgi:hypothetical protein